MTGDERELRRLLRAAAEEIHVPQAPMRPRSRGAAPALFGTLAAVALLVAAAIVGQRLVALRDDVADRSTPTPAAPSVSATASPAPTSDPSSATYVTLLERSWQPVGPTLLVEHRAQSGAAPNEATILAVAPNGEATRLVEVRESGGWSVRPDGSAIVVSIGTSRLPPTQRLAFVDLRAGTVRWLTPDEPGVVNWSPVWSADGSLVYFGRYRDITDLGIFRVDLAGGAAERVVDPVFPRFATPFVVTSDGLLLWGRAHEGSTLEVLELASGRNRSLVGTQAYLYQSVRLDQPRVAAVTAAAGTGASRGLTLWNDTAGITSEPFPTAWPVLSAAWDGDGRRLAVVAAAAPREPFAVFLLDDSGGRRRLDDSADAQVARWIGSSIAYLAGGFRSDGIPSPAAELRIIAADGGASRSLFSAEPGQFLTALVVVSP